MTREQHNAACHGVNSDRRTPPFAPLPSGADGWEPQPEQAALLQTAGLLIPSLTHAMSNPLCGVRSVLERLSRKPLQDEAERHLLHLALQQCDQMRLLLRELQEFVAPPSVDPATFALDQSLESVLRLVSKHLRICGCGVEYLRPTRPLLLHGEERRIRLLLMHLLLHGCPDFLEAGGCLHIQTEVDDAKSQLSFHWQLASPQGDLLSQPLPGSGQPPWFESILHQHGGALQVAQRADGLILLTLFFPLPQEEIR